MSETSEILRTVLDRLTWAENQGLCTYLRLNSGNIFQSYTSKKTGITKGRRIKLCPVGTADVVVFQLALRATRVTFIETKAKGGTLSLDQKDFRRKVVARGAKYWVVTNVDQLEDLWN